MNEPLLTDKDHILWLLLHQTTDTVLNAREKDLSQYGISTVESRVLFVIQANGNNVTPAEIARWTLRKNHTVSALLERMRKKGLITKVRDLDRKNVWRVSLTEKGRDAYRQSIKRESIHKILSVLSLSSGREEH